MKPNDQSAYSEILRQVGFESRTLLNGITGPIQLIRSLSNDPNLLETLHILELSTIRFEKFSLRAQLLSDLLNPNLQPSTVKVNLADLIKHAALELNDFFNFYGVTPKIEPHLPKLEVDASSDIVYQSVLIVFEQFMSVLNPDSSINVTGEENAGVIKIHAFDSGFVADKFKQFTSASSVDIDIALFEQCFSMFGIHYDISRVDGHTVLAIGAAN